MRCAWRWAEAHQQSSGISVSTQTRVFVSWRSFQFRCIGWVQQKTRQTSWPKFSRRYVTENPAQHILTLTHACGPHHDSHSVMSPRRMAKSGSTRRGPLVLIRYCERALFGRTAKQESWLRCSGIGPARGIRQGKKRSECRAATRMVRDQARCETWHALVKMTAFETVHKTLHPEQRARKCLHLPSLTRESPFPVSENSLCSKKKEENHW